MPGPKFHALEISPSYIPLTHLCKENGIDYEFVNVDLMNGANKSPEFLAMNPMHCIPVMQDGDLTLWESRTIGRYICNKHKLEQHYPSDPAKRALVDLALDWHFGTLYPLVSQNVLYPPAGLAPAPPKEAVEEAEKRWNADLLPAFQLLLKKSGGPLLGGDKPNLADLYMIVFFLTCNKCPDSFIAKCKTVQDYVGALKGAIPKFQETMSPAMPFWTP